MKDDPEILKIIKTSKKTKVVEFEGTTLFHHIDKDLEIIKKRTIKQSKWKCNSYQTLVKSLDNHRGIFRLLFTKY